VRGEGVGVLVLKRLVDAEAETDHIWGVIAGSAENHGGRAASLTSPNVKAQAALLRKAMAGIDPGSISYIETHGTGTSLGDPAEINALKLAWSDSGQTDPGISFGVGTTGLGSLKSNIGHLEAASGVAGVIKILLSMAQRHLPPSLHCREVNPLVKLDDSPFYLVRDLREWDVPSPRRAGVSSFGFGGSNAHIVLEEYVERRPESRAGTTLCLVVLSARNENRLIAMAVSLRDFLAQVPDTRLEDVAYTLQTGREAMEERIGFTVRSIPELEARLSEFIDGKKGDFQQGRARDALTSERFLEDEDLAELVAMWVHHGELSRLVDAWVRGHAINWTLLYPEDKPRRISLPAYPFLNTRHWPFDRHNSDVSLSNGEIHAGNRLFESNHTNAQNGKKQDTPALDLKPDDNVNAQDIEMIIRSLAAEILKVSAIDDGNSFQHYGLDSISGMQLAVRLEKRLKCTVPPQSLLSFPTAPRLAAYLTAGAAD
jgi:polyketide synthase PksN